MSITIGVDVYTSVTEADAYWTKRGNAAWLALDLADKEKFLVLGCDYLDHKYRYRGNRIYGNPREFPREYAEDDNCNPIVGYPLQLKDANCLVADALRQGIDLEGIVTNDAAIKSEKVGPITVEYDVAAKSRGAAQLPHVDDLLSQLTLGPQLLRS